MPKTIPTPGPAATPGDTRKVLILSERNDMVRTAESMYLEMQGFQVQAVGCVRRYLSERPQDAADADVVIIDYCLDCARGPSSCVAALRESFADTPILMLCADTRIAADGGLSALVDGFLHKPTSPQTLTDTIAELAGRRSSDGA